jgi:uncharacterized protein YcbK (DUF882 family)
LAGIAREFSVPSGPARAGKKIVKNAATCIGIAAFILLLGSRSLQTAVADGDTRTLSFRHAHTHETITVTFKRNGRYDRAALKKLDHLMRDWRKDEEVAMEPHLFDLLWEVYREVGGKQPIEVICGYRSPSTNTMLRKRSNGVARDSLHTKGDAIDFYIPGVPLEKIRNAGLRLQRGGVGFYPSSGSPFVHMDVGSIRHWPRMTHDQLVKVFPDGRTVHIPTGGQPLKGFALALADVERHGKTPSSVTLAYARDAGVIDRSDAEVAAAAEAPNRTLIAGTLATLPEAAMTDPTKRPAGAMPIAVASLAPPVKVTTVAAVPMPKHRPSKQIALAARIPTPQSRPALPVQVAAADPIVTASAGQALAYAPVPVAAPPAPTAPIGMDMPKLERAEAAAMPVAFTQPMTRSGDPWLRATMLAPNLRYFLTAMPLGPLETRRVEPLLHKPRTPVVMMSFSADPGHGLRADRFSGEAVVFLATLQSTMRTAALAR